MAPTNDTSALDPYPIVRKDAKIYADFLRSAISDQTRSQSSILESIPSPAGPSYGPMATLSTLLSTATSPWPVLDLQLAYTRCWKALPEDAKAGRANSDEQQLIDITLAQCKQSYTSLLDLLHTFSAEDAIVDPGTGHSIQHSTLAASIRDFAQCLPPSQNFQKPVIAIALPNGPLLALTVMATASYWTAAPLAHGCGVGSEQFKSDVLQSGASIVFALEEDVSRLGLQDAWLAEAQIQVLFVNLDSEMQLSMKRLDGAHEATQSSSAPEPNNADDTAIILFTSGTSGTKKLVPLSLHSMICGVAMVVESWNLSPSMRCLNQMPLNHVGGLIRNLFAPILSGGSVICCSAFDAQLFWDCVEDYRPTWYYASPSMHQCILEAAEERPEALSQSQIRLVCNAAGGLLPSLASRLQNIFHCTILPSYGMTECMPISTPPQHYRLEKPGTSGVSVGPEVIVLDGDDQAVGPGSIGRIAVRGLPTFAGYRKGGLLDRSCFTDDGWFDTGDMGYLDNEGYLYITGRSKEVINRGGELISPFEVEEAIIATAADPSSPTYGRVSKALAFSVPHDVLQEVVGICVVTPIGAKRTCLRSVQSALRDVLAQAKIPTLIVFLDEGLPMNHNKVLRIRLAERLCLPELSDLTNIHQRHYEAVRPPPNSSLSVKIDCQPVDLTSSALIYVCRSLLPSTDGFDLHVTVDDMSPRLCIAPQPNGTTAGPPSADTLVDAFAGHLHSYQIPASIHILDHPLPRTMYGTVDEAALHDLLQPEPDNERPSDLTQTEHVTASLFARILQVEQQGLSKHADFFHLGGDSMKAGRLLSLLRKEFKSRLTIDLLFSSPTIASLAAALDSPQLDAVKPTENTQADAHSQDDILPGCEKTCSSTNPLVLVLQLVPICLFYPMKRAFSWTVFIYCLSWSFGLNAISSIPGRLLALVVSMFIARTITRLLAPLLAIAFKWVVMGRYREGLYPMWGCYHTRWWLCQKAIQITGMGAYGQFNWSRCFFYRALGAKIGKNVTLNKGATLGEYDLLTIEDDVNLERCTVRPFAAERNTSMYLGRITLGRNCSVGLGSIVAAGTNVPFNACIGPNSSSWEVDDADEANRDLASSKIAGAHWALNLLLGLPLQFMTAFIGALPWLGCLAALVHSDSMFSIADPLRSVIVWFATPERVGLHYAAMAANAAIGPLFLFAAVLTTKKAFNICCGPVQRDHVSKFSQTMKFRRQLMRTLMPAPRFHKLTELFGSHYEATSVFMRAMGAKVGERVYWPGTGPSIQDYDLIEVGDDVVFGSRSHLVTSDATGSERIHIRSGAMVADRVVLLPGVTLGEKTVMGSGALTRRNGQYADETTWVGSKKGDSICLSAPAAVERQASEATTVMPASFNSSSTTLATKHGELELTDLPARKKRPSHLYPPRDLKVKFADVEVRPARTSMTVSRDGSTNLTPKPDTASPFGRAFYQKQATYRVWSQLEIFLYSTLITIATAIYWNISSISGTQILSNLMTNHPSFLLSPSSAANPIAFYALFLFWTIFCTTLQSLLVLLILIAAKWILLGRRKPGNYSWDTSPYCQRWQLYLKLESLRRKCHGGTGILGLLTGTHYMALYFRALGATIGPHCSLFSGGLPSLLFTEPDLLILGERVSVDDASLVAHINTRGKFDLNPLSVGDRSVLRSGSRLLSGARMEGDACLLEHTLVMAGDVVDAGVTMQGWPGEEFKGGSRMPTLRKRVGWGVRRGGSLSSSLGFGKA